MSPVQGTRQCPMSKHVHDSLLDYLSLEQEQAAILEAKEHTKESIPVILSMLLKEPFLFASFGDIINEAAV